MRLNKADKIALVFVMGIILLFIWMHSKQKNLDTRYAQVNTASTGRQDHDLKPKENSINDSNASDKFEQKQVSKPTESSINETKANDSTNESQRTENTISESNAADKFNQKQYSKHTESSINEIKSNDNIKEIQNLNPKQININGTNLNADDYYNMNETATGVNLYKGDDQDSINKNVLTEDTRRVLRTFLQCKNKDYIHLIRQKGKFWTIRNYIIADHGPVPCYDTITFTTTGDYTSLDKLLPVVERWLAPVSLALYTPGTDFEDTLDSIRYVRDCLNTELIKKFVTFHLFFPKDHMLNPIPQPEILLKESFNCSIPPPYHLNKITYRTEKKLLYPINIGRNLAIEASLTHFFITSDLEAIPSLHLVTKFLDMIAKNPLVLDKKTPRIFPLNVFEMQVEGQVPGTKTELIESLQAKKAEVYQEKVCPLCYATIKKDEWISANETSTLDVFTVEKRTGEYRRWEPTYIGTHAEFLYEERLMLEGKADKTVQSYIFCVQDYDFMVLNNAFMIRTYTPNDEATALNKHGTEFEIAVNQTNTLLSEVIYPELKTLFGIRGGCV